MGASDVYLGAASAWEIAIKASLGKLAPPRNADGAFERSGVAVLLATS